MGRFSYQDAENYGSNGGGTSFFALKNDGDVARVRFMYNDMNDVEGLAVHEIEVGDKRRYISCLREYNEPKSKCPLCERESMQKAKLYIPVYDIDEEEVKIWERGKNFFGKISSICARYANGDTPLVSHIFEVERHGKKGDTQTSYEIFEVGCDETKLSDLPEIPDVLGTLVLDKTADEINEFIRTGTFSDNGSTATADEPIRRRTPARDRGESF